MNSPDPFALHHDTLQNTIKGYVYICDVKIKMSCSTMGCYCRSEHAKQVFNWQEYDGGIVQYPPS